MPERFAAVVVVTLLVGVPLGVLVTIAVARRRIAGGWERAWAWRASAAEMGMVVGTVPWVWMILTPTDGAGGVQLVPFRDLLNVLAGSDTRVQIIGNLLVFAALGFCLPIRFRLAHPVLVVPVVGTIAAGLSAVLETLQFFLHLGRVSSIDDVILNATGAAVASVLSIPLWRSRIRPPDRWRSQGEWVDDRTMADIPSPIAAFIDATNAGDSDAFVAAFTEDGSLDDWGRVARGRDAIRAWDRTDNVGKQSHFELVDIATETEPETYLVHLRVSGNGFNGTSPFRFTLRGAQIERVVIVPD